MKWPVKRIYVGMYSKKGDALLKRIKKMDVAGAHSAKIKELCVVYLDFLKAVQNSPDKDRWLDSKTEEMIRL